MKRYLAFYGSEYYPSGGIGDFLCSFDTFEDAETCILNENIKENGKKCFKYNWGQVYDSVENKTYTIK